MFTNLSDYLNHADTTEKQLFTSGVVEYSPGFREIWFRESSLCLIESIRFRKRIKFKRLAFPDLLR